MGSSQVISSIVGLIIGVGIGYLLGQRRGRPQLGALLGLLGCLGWVIILLIPKDKTRV